MLTLKYLENALHCKNDDADVFTSLVGMPFDPILAAAYESAQIKRNKILALVFDVASTYRTFFHEKNDSLMNAYADFFRHK